MRNNEFNQNMQSEFSSHMEQEISRAIEWNPSHEEFSKAPEYEISEEFSEQNTEKNAEYARKSLTYAEKKKVLKMMMATVGTVAVLSATNIGNTSANIHEGCIHSTEYNTLFEEIIELTETEDYISLAQLIDSDQMENCVQTLFPDIYTLGNDENISNSVAFMYNGEYVSNCDTNYYDTEYERDDINVFVTVFVGQKKNIVNDSKNSYDIYLTPKINMTEEYITKEAPIDVVKIHTNNHVYDESYLNSYSPAGILRRDELISCGILEFPPSISVDKLTLTGPGIGENFERYRADICGHQDSDDNYSVEYLNPIQTFSSEYWDNGPKGHTTAYQTWGGNLYYEYDFVIDKDGHAVAEQSYRSFMAQHINVNSDTVTYIPTTESLAENEDKRVYYEQIYENWEDIFNLFSAPASDVSIP